MHIYKRKGNLNRATTNVASRFCRLLAKFLPASCLTISFTTWSKVTSQRANVASVQEEGRWA